MNLIDPFLAAAERHPERIALIAGRQSIRYRELAEQSGALAARLRGKGLVAGDIALPVLGIGIPLYVTLLAFFRLGIAALVPEPATGLRGLRSAARTLPVRALVGDWRRILLHCLLPELWRAEIVSSAARAGESDIRCELPPETPALITFTSGSTGRPKGIVRSQGFLIEQHKQVSAALHPEDGDIDLISLPVFILSNLACGVTSVIPDGDLQRPAAVDPAPLLRQIERHGVKRLLLPPALCARLAETGACLPAITQIFTGGGPVFPDLMRRLAKLAPQARITAVYGSSEAEPIAHIALDAMTDADFADMAEGQGLLAGRPVVGVSLRIEDDEIWVTGPHVVKGYLDPADNAATKCEIDGEVWHRTGDAGRFDAAGRLWLLGRREARYGDLFPFAVETAARSLPGVCAAALVVCGASPVLVIEREPSAPAIPEEWARRWHASLRLIELARIPMDRRHNSKVDYGRLRQMLTARGVDSPRT